MRTQEARAVARAGAQGRSYEQRYPRAYAALKREGFSAFFALRLLVDAKRKERPALLVIKLARRA